MTSGKSKSHTWQCPKCGDRMVVFVQATEVVCANKEKHTSMRVRMVELGREKVA